MKTKFTISEINLIVNDISNKPFSELNGYEKNILKYKKAMDIDFEIYGTYYNWKKHIIQEIISLNKYNAWINNI